MAARPRRQRGWVRKVGPSWIGYYYVYETRDGEEHRIGPREKKIGPAVSVAGGTAMSKTEAKMWFERWLDKTVNRPGELPLQPTMAELWAIHERRYDRTEPGSARTMRSLWEVHLKDTWGNVMASLIKRRDIEQYFDQNQGGYSQKVKLKAILKQLFELAVRNDAIEYSPMKDAYLRFDDDQFSGTLSATEVRAIRQKMPDSLSLLKFDVLWNLGLSRSEFTALRCDDISIDGVRVDEKVFEGKAGRVKTFRRKGTVPCPDDLMGRLIHWRGQRLVASLGDERAWLWPAQKGNGPADPDVFTRVMQAAAVAAGVTAKIDFRVMRRTFGTLAADQKGVASSSGVLRNSAATAAKHYTKAAAEAKLSTVSAVEAEVMGKGTVVQ